MDVTNQLEAVFKSYCATGKSEMANKEFCKLNKECGLYDKLYTANDVDIIFAKSKPKTSKTLSYGHFEDALKHIAEKKKIEYEKLVESISSHGVQSYTGTKADYVKFHDDKSLYTGVYAKGGPSNVDIGNGGGISDISQLCDRSGADVRGVKK